MPWLPHGMPVGPSYGRVCQFATPQLHGTAHASGSGHFGRQNDEVSVLAKAHVLPSGPQGLRSTYFHLILFIVLGENVP